MRMIKLLKGTSMKSLFLLTILFYQSSAIASMPATSGVYGVSDKVIDKYSAMYESSTSTKAYSINLIVTSNDLGQQFFIQCSKGSAAGFGVITEFKNKHKLNAIINAGPECPSDKLRVELDFDQAVIRFGDKWILLIGGEVGVPYYPFK
jgi:hypothetical protein